MPLLAVEPSCGVLWECACGDGAISRILESAGFEADEGGGRGEMDETTPGWDGRPRRTAVGGQMQVTNYGLGFPLGSSRAVSFGEYGSNASPSAPRLLPA